MYIATFLDDPIFFIKTNKYLIEVGRPTIRVNNSYQFILKTITLGYRQFLNEFARKVKYITHVLWQGCGQTIKPLQFNYSIIKNACALFQSVCPGIITFLTRIYCSLFV